MDSSDKQIIIDQLKGKYHSFIDYMNELSPEDYSYSNGQKWTAGQQLEHIVLCVQPLDQVLGMDKLNIGQKFGLSGGPGRTYEALRQEYIEKLGAGGKAPERYLPERVAPEQKPVLCATLAETVKDLCAKIENFTEQELDTLCIPHPLLGNLTMREMLYNAIYHVEHHHTSARQNLKSKP